MMKRIVMVFGAMLACGYGALAVPTVTDVVAKQRFPWNGLVDITCKVTGIEGTTNVFWFTVAVVMPDTGKVRNVAHIMGGKVGQPMVIANGTKRLVWDASADLGQVTYDNMIVRVNLDVRRRVQLWAGGPFWAETNIGAEKPEDYGYYFWWGDTVGYKYGKGGWTATDGSLSGFSFSLGNTPTIDKNIATLKSEGWITADEVLAPEHDAAHVQWGGSWRMPTKQELSDLVSKCSWQWYPKGDLKGYLVCGKGDYSSVSIYLPCASYGEGTSRYYFPSSKAYYWSSVPYPDSRHAWNLFFEVYDNAYGLDTKYYYRSTGQTIRPVQGFTE